MKIGITIKKRLFFDYRIFIHDGNESSRFKCRHSYHECCRNFAIGWRVHTNENVTLIAGAGTAWYTHPAGQTLIVVSGLSWAQVEDGAIREIQPGDVICLEHNEKHWHGASANKAMSHIAVQEEVNGEVVKWIGKVSDEPYRK